MCGVIHCKVGWMGAKVITIDSCAPPMFNAITLCDTCLGANTFVLCLLILDAMSVFLCT